MRARKEFPAFYIPGELPLLYSWSAQILPKVFLSSKHPHLPFS